MLFKEVFFIVTLFLCYFDVTKCSTTDHPVLLVISLDGFRADYFDRGLTPTLEVLRRCGTYAPHLRPVFPTKTFVNHFSIATGLYAGTHGVLGNELYDIVDGEIRYSYKLFHQNDETLPIWTWNEISGGHSGCMMWPGSDFEYKGKNCTFTQIYDENMTREQQVDKVISWIQHPTTPTNLVMMYVNQPDDVSHAYGPDDQHQYDMLKNIDAMFSYLLRNLHDEKLGNRVNIVVVSDHGMSDIPATNFIDLTKILTPGTYKLGNSSPLMQIIPAPGFEKEVFEKLSDATKEGDSHFKVYNNETVPGRWKVRNENRFGPILAVAEPHYGFQDLVDLAKWFRDNRNVPYTNESHYGNHGYDNMENEMKAIFFAYGPLFNERQAVSAFNNVDLYSLFCRVLNIEVYKTEGADRMDIWKRTIKRLTPTNEWKPVDRFCHIFKGLWQDLI